MKINKKEIISYFYMFLLLGFSGNPLFISPDNSKIIFIFATVFLLMLNYKKLLKIKKSRYLYIFIIFFFLIFVFQFFVLGFVSFMGALGFLLKLSFGYIIIAVIGKKFKYYYFNLIFYLSIISLIGYLWNVLGYDIPAVFTLDQTNLYSDNSGRNIIIFNQKADGLRNSGMFWEPGAFSAYILFGLLLFIGEIKELIKNNNKKLIIIFIALITTFSTTGYLLLFLLALVTLIFEYGKSKNIIYIFFLVPIFIYIGYVVYTKNDFMRDKIESQLETSVELDGEYNSSRFGSFLFDLHYIKKHPLVGNGFHEKTRLSDHSDLIGEKLGNGNGFSDFLGDMGFLSLIFYSFFIIKWKSNQKYIFLVFIFLLLQGEPLMNYPLFLTIPFILLFNETKTRRIINLPQQKR